MTSTDAHVGDLLLDLLLSHAVDTVFGLPGGQTAALYDAIDRRPGTIRHVLVRDERTAAYAADAYARITGRVGVCDATVGPGAAKLPSGLGEAFNSSVPVLALVSELPSSTEARRYRGATSQALDQEALLRPVTKWLATVRRQEDLAPLLRRAFRESTTGRPGPVALVLPQDVLDEASRTQLRTDPQAGRFGRFPAIRVLPDSDDVAAVADLLRTARRPLMVLGGGALASGVADVVLRVAEAFGAAVATTLSGKGCVDEGHPLAVGVLGTMGTSAAARAAREATALLLVGTKAGSASTLGWSIPRSDQAFAQIDVDPAELGRDHPASAVVLADARAALEALLAVADERGWEGGGSPEWRQALRRLVAEWRSRRDGEGASDDVPVRPQRVIRELQRVLQPTDLVISDASLASGWVGAYLEQSRAPRRVLFPRGLAGLGWAVPAAIGAAVAAPGSRVVAVMGDGALAYAVGEFATVVQHDLDVKTIVLNNSSYGWIRWYRRITFGRGWEHDDVPETDYAAVAAAYGLATERVRDPEQLTDVFDKALGHRGPALVEILSSVWDTPLEGHREALRAGIRGAYGS